MSLSVGTILMSSRYNPETGELISIRHGQPFYMEQTPGGPRVEIKGYKIHARRVALVHILGRFPEPHEFKHIGESKNDLRACTFIPKRVGDSKLCTGCRCMLPMSSFHKDSGQRTGYAPKCKECIAADQRRYAPAARRRKYNLTKEQHDALIQAQGNRCKVCGVHADQEHYKTLAIDHCHETGKVRGLLCAKCNTAIGQFRDDPKIILNAAKYVLEAKRDGGV